MKRMIPILDGLPGKGDLKGLNEMNDTYTRLTAWYGRLEKIE